MPGFDNHSAFLAKGITYRAGMTSANPEFESDPALTKSGKELAGLTGYACITCHAAGETPALQAFEGQGPNLQLSGQRLRPGYYHSWMHWPQRFAPLTIMPKYTVDKKRALNATFYDGDARKQFDAVWHYIQTLEGAEKAPVPKPEE